MKNAGQVNSVTIGSFTVFDSEAVDGDGCNGVYVVDNTSSTPYDIGYESSHEVDSGNGGFGWTTDQGTGSSHETLVADYSVADTFQAVLADGSSMVTGTVGDESPSSNTGETQYVLPNGLHPCVDVGGVAGT